MAVTKQHQVADPVRTEYEDSEAVAAARAKTVADPRDADAWMELGLALSRSMLMRESVEAFSRAIALDPFKGIYYRHRGHRHVSCWEFPEAAADFETAARLIPDNWDVWYHLGLSYYLMREYDLAQAAYRRCLEITDMTDIEAYPAVIDWSWRTARRRGDEKLAAELIALLPADFPYDDDECGYGLNCAVYQGRVTLDEALEICAGNDELHGITNLYALANYCRETGDAARADELLDKAIDFGDATAWCAFGYLAAAVDKGII